MVVEFVVTVNYMIIHSVSKIYSFASVGVITITKVTWWKIWNINTMAVNMTCSSYIHMTLWNFNNFVYTICINYACNVYIYSDTNHAFQKSDFELSV